MLALLLETIMSHIVFECSIGKEERAFIEPSPQFDNHILEGLFQSIGNAGQRVQRKSLIYQPQHLVSTP